jgi:hypothetical protein
MIFFPCDSMISRWVGYTCLWQDDKFRLDVVHGIIFVTNWIIFMIFYYNILYESIGSTRINNLNNDCTKVESIRFFLEKSDRKEKKIHLHYTLYLFIFVEKEKCQYVLEGFVG